MKSQSQRTGKFYRPKPRSAFRGYGSDQRKSGPTKNRYSQKLRCNLCGKVYTAQAPVGGGVRVYDETAAAMIGVLRYGTGLPFYRLEQLQRNLGIPLPASTQWDIIQAHVYRLVPVYRELIRQAAQGELFHNDDTSARILSLMGKRKQTGDQTGATLPAGMDREELPDDRTGIFTSGVVSVTNEQRMVMFFTGRHHAGENLGLVLKQRIDSLATPTLMCDGLSSLFLWQFRDRCFSKLKFWVIFIPNSKFAKDGIQIIKLPTSTLKPT
jgi:hypothetical protein